MGEGVRTRYSERIEELEEQEERLWERRDENGRPPKSHGIIMRRIQWEHRDRIYHRAKQRGLLRVMEGGKEESKPIEEPTLW